MKKNESAETWIRTHVIGFKVSCLNHCATTLPGTTATFIKQFCKSKLFMKNSKPIVDFCCFPRLYLYGLPSEFFFFFFFFWPQVTYVGDSSRRTTCYWFHVQDVVLIRSFVWVAIRFFFFGLKSLV